MTATLRRRGTRRDRAWDEARAAWQKRAVMYGCAVCPARGWPCEGRPHAHHWLYEQHIRQWLSAHAHEHDLPQVEIDRLELALVWAPDNAGGVCERAHRRHHNRTDPIPLALVPIRAISFASSLDLGYHLEACYPAVTSAR